MSSATGELVRADLPAPVELRDLGSHRLRDLARAESIYQMVVPDLPEQACGDARAQLAALAAPGDPPP